MKNGKPALQEVRGSIANAILMEME